MPDAAPQQLQTRHGAIPFPAFLPDATRAGVRGATADDLRNVGIPALVVNAFHLLRRPGVRVVQAGGGVHQFMHWDRPILSDSGGFQVYSLIRQNPDHGVIRANEVIFRDPADNSKITLTPEKVVQMQFQLGSDIVVCLDDCTDTGDDRDEQARSVERTLRWAKRSREEFDRRVNQLKDPTQRPLLFAVVQGGDDEELRRGCAQELTAIGFDGFGFGGWPLDANGALLSEVLGWVADALPADAPKHALGIGRMDHVVATHALGFRMFDCSLPTRDARHGRLYAFRPGFPQRAPQPGESFFSTVYALDAQMHADRAPVDAGCDCPLCTHYSRAYLHHLFRIGDHSAERLATLHNLRAYVRLMDALRGGPADSTAANTASSGSN